MGGWGGGVLLPLAQCVYADVFFTSFHAFWFFPLEGGGGGRRRRSPPPHP
jgi:hypothetical protein